MLNPGTHANRPRQALALCRCLAFLDEPNAADLIAGVAAREWNEPGVVRMRPMDAMTPAWCSITFPSAVIVVINGVRTNEQINSIIRGYFEPPSHSVTPGASIAFTLPANAIQAMMVSDGLLGGVPCVIAGHSYGGCIAAVLAARLINPGRQGLVSYVSFGAPKPGDESFAAYVSAIPKIRLMNPRDPVPKIWPTVDEAPLAFVAQRVGVIRNAQRYVQTNGGYEFADAGGITPSLLPSGTLRIAEVDLTNWLRALTLDEASAHRIEVYLTNLSRYVDTLPVLAEAVEVKMGKAQEAHIDPFEAIRVGMGKILSAIKERGVTQSQGRANIPLTQRFVAFVEARIWGVKFAGVTIAWGIRKRRATHMAFVGNLLLREYLKTGISYPDGFTKAWQGFLEAAKTGDGGITPRLQTTLPVID